MALSLAQRVARMPAVRRRKWLASLKPGEAAALPYSAEFMLRPEQLEIVNDRSSYATLVLCGRG